MVFEKGEYSISDDGEKITISKKVLEEWRNHYKKVVRDEMPNNIMMAYYNGKSEVFRDILKMFEPLEG